MKYYRHSTAVVESKKIGKGTTVWQHTVILKGAKIGINCNINCHCFIDNDVVVGDNVTLKSGVYLWDGITIENDVFVGPNATFTNDTRPRSKQRPAIFDRTTLKKGCSIGAGAVILGGISIGEYAMIGAGAVVTKNVPRNTLWYGNPAKNQGFICDCGEKLNKKFICAGCGSQYRISARKLLRSA